MATRRQVPPNEKPITISESQGGPPASSITSDTRPAVPASVITKLLLFTLAMVVMPIGSYFLALPILGSSTWAGALAALMANVVLIGYIIVAMWEDQGDNAPVKGVIESKKAR